MCVYVSESVCVEVPKPEPVPAGVRVDMLDKEVYVCVEMRVLGVVSWEIRLYLCYFLECLVSYFGSTSVSAFA